MSNERPSTFTWIDAAGAIALVLITIFAVTFAVQEHNDRVLSNEITGTASELQDTDARITSIRDAEMKDMNDYIRAYSEIAPLLDAYDRRVQRITDLYNEAHEGDWSFSECRRTEKGESPSTETGSRFSIKKEAQ